MYNVNVTYNTCHACEMSKHNSHLLGDTMKLITSIYILMLYVHFRVENPTSS